MSVPASGRITFLRAKPGIILEGPMKFELLGALVRLVPIGPTRVSEGQRFVPSFVTGADGLVKDGTVLWIGAAEIELLL